MSKDRDFVIAYSTKRKISRGSPRPDNQMSDKPETLFDSSYDGVEDHDKVRADHEMSDESDPLFDSSYEGVNVSDVIKKVRNRKRNEA